MSGACTAPFAGGMTPVKTCRPSIVICQGLVDMGVPRGVGSAGAVISFLSVLVVCGRSGPRPCRPCCRSSPGWSSTGDRAALLRSQAGKFKTGRRVEFLPRGRAARGRFKTEFAAFPGSVNRGLRRLGRYGDKNRRKAFARSRGLPLRFVVIAVPTLNLHDVFPVRVSRAAGKSPRPPSAGSPLDGQDE